MNGWESISVPRMVSRDGVSTYSKMARDLKSLNPAIQGLELLETLVETCSKIR